MSIVSPSRGAVAYVGMGGNIGNVLGTFRSAVDAMRRSGIEVTAISRAYRTKAMLPEGWQGDQDDYWNTVCQVRSALLPSVLLRTLLNIEKVHGRTRAVKWAPRSLDLDLLLYGTRSIRFPDLVVPHPGLCERTFVLQPLSDVALNARIPGRNTTVAEVIAELERPYEGILEVQSRWLEGERTSDWSLAALATAPQEQSYRQAP